MCPSPLLSHTGPNQHQSKERYCIAKTLPAAGRGTVIATDPHGGKVLDDIHARLIYARGGAGHSHRDRLSWRDGAGRRTCPRACPANIRQHVCLPRRPGTAIKLTGPRGPGPRGPTASFVHRLSPQWGSYTRLCRQTCFPMAQAHLYPRHWYSPVRDLLGVTMGTHSSLNRGAVRAAGPWRHADA